MFETVVNGPLINKPPPYSTIKVISSKEQFGGTGFSKILDAYNDQQLARLLVSESNFLLLRGTPVEDVLMKIVGELRTKAASLTPAWRWKVMKKLPVNMEDKSKFLSDFKIRLDTIRNVISLIFASVVPEDLLGKDNDVIITDFLVNYITCTEKDRFELDYPKMYIKHSLPLRAMRNSIFRKNLEKVCVPLNIIQKSTLIYINNFITKVVVSLFLQFVYVSYSYDSVATFYSKRAFNFFRKKEMRQFKEDYRLEKVKQSVEETAAHVISKTRIVVSGTSMRPICPFPKVIHWNYANELQFINKALDYYLEDTNHRNITGIHLSIRKLKQFLSRHRTQNPNRKLYFIKADVSKCFANMKHDILKNLLESLVGGRTAVVAFIVIKAMLSRSFRVFGVGGNTSAALQDLKKNKFKKDHKDSLGRVQYKMFGPDIVDLIMKIVGELRFTIYGNNQQLYRMAKGVPQGCVLSSRLSHIYLLDYDKNILKPLLTDGSKLFRYADDYLVVLDDKERAIEILDQLQHPQNAYGLYFKKEKTQISFNGGDYTKDSNLIKWCGATIDAKRKKVLPKKKATSLKNRKRKHLHNSRN